MKNLSLWVIFLFMITACNSVQQNTKKENTNQDKPKVEGSYGELISEADAVPVSSLKAMMSDSDTLPIKLVGEVVASCQHTGCWMDLAIDDNTPVKVTFKDNAFTIPLDSKGKKAYVDGYAIKELIPVETLRHYAMDEGKSKEEIEKITQPEMAYTFEASGVLLEDNQ